LAKIANLSTGHSASPSGGLGLVGILPCSLHWQPPGKAPKLLSYSSGARSASQPYAMPASGNNNCCGSCSNGCCQDCHCCKQDYEHLPVPRLRHQQPPPPLYQNPQNQQQHQQVSCITTLQQTTTTQQLQQIPTPATSSIQNISYGNCLMPPTTTTSSTYVSNMGPEPSLLPMQHCHAHCNGYSSNMQPCSNNSPAQSMILVPFMLPMQQQHLHQQQQQHFQVQPPLPPAEDGKCMFQAKSVPPPPQPPPLLTHFQSLLQPPPLPPPSPLMPQPPVACPLPSRTPATPPLPATHNVQSLKSAAASAVGVYQRVSTLKKFYKTIPFNHLLQKTMK